MTLISKSEARSKRDAARIVAEVSLRLSKESYFKRAFCAIAESCAHEASGFDLAIWASIKTTVGDFKVHND